ncbi:MAG TPA: AAA family ATPase [Terriglobia bacterium]|nr:AAA family ATPase [Terriglobia bacterium]
MKILTLETRNFRNLTDREWKFDTRFQVVRGPNEAGKSSLLEAILVALFADATSSDKRYKSYCRWNSAEHICVAADLALKAGQLRLERDFENGKNRCTIAGKTVQAKDKVRNFLAEHLPIAVEESFRQTACVMQDEIKSDINPSQLKSQLENRSLSSTGRDLANLQKELDNHNNELRRGWLTTAPRNPGPVKVLLDELQTLREDLAEREAREKQAVAAVTDFELADAEIEKITRDISQAEERQDLDRKYVEAESLYKQKEIEIGELTTKRARVGQLPQLLESMEAEFQRLADLFQKQKAKREQALRWKQRAADLENAQDEVRQLANDIQNLEAFNQQLKDLVNPLTSLGLTAEDFTRFHALEQKLADGKEELDRLHNEEARLAKDIEENRGRLAPLGQQETEQEVAIATLESERGLADQVRQSKGSQQQLLVEYRRVSEKAARLTTLLSQRLSLAAKLEPFRSLSDIDPKAFHEAVASVNHFENALQGEGLGFEFNPDHPVPIKIQIDSGPEREVQLDTPQKFTGRRQITASIPGVGTVRLTNESQTAQQLQQRQSEIAAILSRAAARDVDDLARRFEDRDRLAADVRSNKLSLEAALESRSKESWDQEFAELGGKVAAVAAEIEKLAAVRELAIVEKDLTNHRQSLKALAKNRAQAETRVQMLVQSLAKSQNAVQAQQEKMRNTQEEMTTLISRTKRETAAGLKVLEDEYNQYANSVAKLQECKAGILKARHESAVYAGHKAKMATIAKLTEEFESLRPFGLGDKELTELENDIKELEGTLGKKRDQVSRLQKEREMLLAERLDEKFNQAVTQAAVADQTRKANLSYAFANPGERIDFGRAMKALKDKLEKLRNSRAELKVKADSAGQDQERVSELKETIAERERRIARLEHRLEIDNAVLRYLQDARNQALADLLGAIPVKVGSLLERITAGRYQRVEGDGFNLQVWSPEKGEKLDQDEMSSGSLDQFYLALRLEAIRSIFADDLPPLILDDPLVSCDPQRRGRIIEILDEHANSGQVIYLTCHDWPELDRFSCLSLP